MSVVVVVVAVTQGSPDPRRSFDLEKHGGKRLRASKRTESISGIDLARTRALRCIGLLRRSSGNITQIEGYPQTSCGIVFERNISPFPKPNDMPEACTRSISRGTYLDAFRAWLISAIDNLSAISGPRTRPGAVCVRARVYVCVQTKVCVQGLSANWS